MDFGLIELSDKNLWVSVLTIMFNPLYWNYMARKEHRDHFLTKFFNGNYTGCTALAISIFILGVYRDYRFNLALESQPRSAALQDNSILILGYFLMVVGTALVLTSYFKLGFYGTFLGDHFGILLANKVTSFPYNIMGNPMYWGSFLNFLGGSLVKASQAGVYLSLLVALTYKIAIQFEEPYTTNIYQRRAKDTLARNKIENRNSFQLGNIQ